MNHFSSLFSNVRQRAAVMAMAAAALGGASFAVQAQPVHEHEHQARCTNCGTVISTHTYQKAAEHGSGLGVAGGAIVGGLLGNHVGSGNGRTLATVAGAVGGGYAGNQIEKNVRKTTMTDVRVRMSNGTERKFTENGNSHRFQGEHVRVVNGHLVAER